MLGLCQILPLNDARGPFRTAHTLARRHCEGESNPLDSGFLSNLEGSDAQIDAQEMGQDCQVLTQIVQAWPMLVEWRKKAVVEIAQVVPARHRGTGKCVVEQAGSNGE